MSSSRKNKIPSHEASDEEESMTEETYVKKHRKRVSHGPKNSNEIFDELMDNQLSTVPPQWKLSLTDMKRICKYVDTSIFDPTQCCIWRGYITNMNNSNKGTYVNFYFKNKKVALHRLLYSNFVSPLESNEYLKFNCENKGICCNIHHYEKYKYSKNSTKQQKSVKPEEVKKSKDTLVFNAQDTYKIRIDFSK